MTPAKPHRWRFSLRALLLLVLAVAVVFGLRQKSIRQHRAARQLAARNAEFTFEHSRQLLPSWLMFGDDRYDHVREIGFTGGDISASDLRQLQQFPGLNEVRFTSIAFRDAALMELGTLPNLESLYFNKCRLTSDDMISLSEFSQLTSLELFNDDELVDLTPLQRLPNLKYLTLDTANNESLESIASLRLKRLRITNAQFTDQDLTALQKWKDLQFLDISGAPVSGSGLRHLQQCKQLERLDLSNCLIDADGVEAIAQLRSLISLSLYRTSLSDEDLLRLRQALPGCQISPPPNWAKP